MAGATENLHDGDNNEKEKNEQNNGGVHVEERPKVPLAASCTAKKGSNPM
jgi:hypothetical protein